MARTEGKVTFENDGKFKGVEPSYSTRGALVVGRAACNLCGGVFEASLRGDLNSSFDRLEIANTIATQAIQHRCWIK